MTRHSYAFAQIATPLTIWLIALVLILVFVVATRLHQRSQHAASQPIAVLSGLRGLGLLVVLLMSLGWTYTRTTTSPPNMILLIDDSQSMGHVDDASSRLQRVQKSLLQQNLLAKLESRARLRVELLSGQELESVAAVHEQIGRLRATHDATPLGERLIQLSGPTQVPQSDAILVFSDGRVTSGRALRAVTSASTGLPLIGIGVGGAYAASDVAVQDALHEDVAHVQDIVRVGVHVSYQGDAQVPTQLILTDAGSGEELARQVVNLLPEQAQRVWMQYRPTATGLNRLVVHAKPLVGETNLHNNTLNVVLWIHDQPIRVLIVQAYPSYEFMQLKGLFGRGRASPSSVDDRSIQVATLLQHADPEYVRTDPVAISTFPDTLEKLDEFDVIILGDVDPKFLAAKDYQNISNFVSERGGGLVVICGPRFMPGEFSHSPLAELMPLRPALTTQTSSLASLSDPRTTSVTKIGGAWPHLWLGTANELRQAWQDLPPIYWLAAVGPLRGSAHTLIEASARSSESSYPVVSTINVGLGRVVMHMTDSTWRWKQAETGNPFETYWRQTIGYLTATRVGADQTMLTSDRPAYNQGALVKLTARWSSASPHKSAENPQEMVIRLKSQQSVVDTITLMPSADTASTALHEAKLPHLPPGRYAAELIRDNELLVSSSFRVDETTLETADPAPDLQALREVARASGGVYLDVNDCERLVSEEYEDLFAAHTVARQIPFWNSPWLAVAFLAIVIAGWLHRKS